jgi:hypothetical protein
MLAGYAALLAAWVVANPLGRAPDEPAHYVRALAVGDGDLFGRQIPITSPGYTPKQQRWIQGNIREFTLPARQSLLPATGCPIGDPTVSAACQKHWPGRSTPVQSSTVGSYQPFTYIPAGLVMRTAPTPWSAFVFGRAMMALMALALVALGAWALWDSDSSPAVLAGLLLALTPGAVFLSATLNPNGVEVAAGACCAAGLLALTRDRAPRSRGWLPWSALGAGGTVLASTRSLGPYFVAALVVLTLVLVGPRRLWRLVRSSPMVAAFSTVFIGGAGLLNMVWEATQEPHLSWGSVLSHLSLGRVPELGREFVAKFGWLEWNLAWPVYVIWGLLVAALVGLALIVGTWRQRATLAGLIALCVALGVAFHSVMPAQMGFDVQGRYLLPLAIATPLLAGEIVRRHHVSRPVMTAAAVVVGLLVGGLQFAAWYLNARRYAVGISGPRWFVGHAQWTPSGGWVLWIAVAALGGLCLASAAAMALVPERVTSALFRRSPEPAPSFGAPV